METIPPSSSSWWNEYRNLNYSSSYNIFTIESEMDQSSENNCSKLPTFEECCAEELPPPSYNEALNLPDFSKHYPIIPV